MRRAGEKPHTAPRRRVTTRPHCSSKDPLSASRIITAVHIVFHSLLQGVDGILEAAVTENVAFLVVGDPFAATTHTDLQLRAKCAQWTRRWRPAGIRFRPVVLASAPWDWWVACCLSDAGSPSSVQGEGSEGLHHPQRLHHERGAPTAPRGRCLCWFKQSRSFSLITLTSVAAGCLRWRRAGCSFTDSARRSP